MEVHHHPQIEKKSFKEYFLEFLMIFLAVTMGFFAENVREYFVNNGKEKEYIHSFYQDLSSDEVQLPELISLIDQQQIKPAEALPGLLAKMDTKTPANLIYILLRKLYWQRGIKTFVTDRTFTEIQNTAEMRLILNKRISDSLIDYYKKIEWINYLQQSLLVYKNKIKDDITLILRADDFRKTTYDYAINPTDSISYNGLYNPPENLYLASVDPATINRIEIEAEDNRLLCLAIKALIVAAKNKATAIKQLIRENYNVER
jgi:hypothetical protein